MRPVFPTALLVLGTALLACAAGDDPLDVVDPAAAPLHPSWEQVETIVKRNCAPCHSEGEGDEDEDGGDDDGNGLRLLEDDDDYSSCAGIVDGTDGIEDEVLESGSMPPGAWPRLSEREKLILKRWIDDGACAPCNPCP
jgi:uncharacterized membrane protein